MPLSEFIAPEITEEYLRSKPDIELVDLLQHKTNGLLTAMRLRLIETTEAKKIGEDVRNIQAELEHRRKN